MKLTVERRKERPKELKPRIGNINSQEKENGDVKEETLASEYK